MRFSPKPFFSPRFLVFWIIILAAILGCNLFVANSTADSTRVALMVEQTRLSGTIAVLTQMAGDRQVSPPAGGSISETLNAVITPTVAEKDVPYVTPDSSIPDLERHIRAAKILVFENMSASGYERFVLNALDQEDYFYLDVGSAAGWFKTQLLSNQEWDLVIAAVESDRSFGGDYFLLIDDRIAKGASAIIEYWNFDAAPNGKQDNLLHRCGVELYSDWIQPDLRVFYWVHKDHPVFSQPNQVAGLRNAAPLWDGDVGDLLRIRTQTGTPVGDAVILASTIPNDDDDHGTLVSCLGGRVILQTFRSHEYQAPDMIRLWKNYIYQTLKARFAVSTSNAPTPEVILDPSLGSPTTLPEGVVPQPGTLFNCGSAFSTQLFSQPVFTKSLFEHHADGEFLLVDLQFINRTKSSIQVWDGDYAVEGIVDNRTVMRGLHKAATGYLFITQPGSLIQDVIDPGESFKVSLAFDVEITGSSWTLLFRPGFEYNEQICEVRIPLTR